MERFINILIVDPDEKIRLGLKEILSGGGNNTLSTDTIEEAIQIIEKKGVGIIIVAIDVLGYDFEKLELLRSISIFKNNYILIISKTNAEGSTLVKAISKGAVDFINYPFNPNLIRSKVEVYKSLYYKDQRIGQLLENIFPPTILEELSNNGKFSPKRVEHGVVLFTDFVDFSSKSKDTQPLQLIRKLEKYFTRFDEIVGKYNLEKIKTIGDAYMALSGVTEAEPMPATRACLAALEMREFLRTERDVAIALGKDFWEIRIGLHMGPLVAGIIGSAKFSFDVWGDTVNIASRAESATQRGKITVTSTIADEVASYFDLRPRGQKEIHKRGGTIEMFYLERLKTEHCLYGDGKSANSALRESCGLPSMDFEHLRSEIINRLKSLLPEKIRYHDIPHTLNVEKAAIRYAQLEGIANEDLFLLRTAVLFHDAGFVRQYFANEDFGIRMAGSILPSFGYTIEQIDIISNIINATKSAVEPITPLEKIMCDADHDYLGRPDYHSIANKLRKEMEEYDRSFSDEEWYRFQLDFLENHHRYYTETARNIRAQGKRNRILELQRKIKELEENESLH